MWPVRSNGVTKVFIGNVTGEHRRRNIGCKFTVKGSTDGTYTNSTGKLAIAPRAGSGHVLKAANANGVPRPGQQRRHPRFKGTYTVTTPTGKFKHQLVAHRLQWPCGIRPARPLCVQAASWRRRRRPVPAHDHQVRLGLGEVVVGRTVDVAAAQRAADTQLRVPGADEVTQPALAGVAAGLGRTCPRRGRARRRAARGVGAGAAARGRVAPGRRPRGPGPAPRVAARRLRTLADAAGGGAPARRRGRSWARSCPRLVAEQGAPGSLVGTVMAAADRRRRTRARERSPPFRADRAAVLGRSPWSPCSRTGVAEKVRVPLPLIVLVAARRRGQDRPVVACSEPASGGTDPDRRVDLHPVRRRDAHRRAPVPRGRRADRRRRSDRHVPHRRRRRGAAARRVRVELVHRAAHRDRDRADRSRGGVLGARVRARSPDAAARCSKASPARTTRSASRSCRA